MVEQVLKRREAVAALLARRDGWLVVTGLGSPTYDVNAAGDEAGNFYLWGAMGGAALVGLGLAQAQQGRQVVVITGDGEQLMAMGSFATIAASGVTNLTLVVLDNQHFGETGMQLSHTGRGVDLVGVALACGWAGAQVVRTMAKVAEAAAMIGPGATGPRLFVLRIAAEPLARSLPSRDAVAVKNRFRAHLGLGGL
jgi:thiamine pyrophosphate-dependent acetolactate synthase large subunit-like protein